MIVAEKLHAPHETMATLLYNNKNTRVGFLRTQITWVKPNEGYLGPQNTDEDVFIFILYLNHQV